MGGVDGGGGEKDHYARACQYAKTQSKAKPSNRIILVISISILYLTLFSFLRYKEIAIMVSSHYGILTYLNNIPCRIKTPY